MLSKLNAAEEKIACMESDSKKMACSLLTNSKLLEKREADLKIAEEKIVNMQADKADDEAKISRLQSELERANTKNAEQSKAFTK